MGLRKTGGSTSVTINLSGFTSNDVSTEHGFHIHAGDSIDSQCGDALGHFNPLDVDHGARSGNKANR